jgi:hypothetical protein
LSSLRTMTRYKIIYELAGKNKVNQISTLK